MGVIFDTSFLIEAERRESEISQFVENREEEVFGISVITVAELLHGVHRADSTKRRLKRSAYVEKVIEFFPIYNFEISIARIYAELWSDLSREGIQIVRSVPTTSSSDPPPSHLDFQWPPITYGTLKG